MLHVFQRAALQCPTLKGARVACITKFSTVVMLIWMVTAV